MSQNSSITTTTSFNLSSNESLNKQQQQLSASQSSNNPTSIDNTMTSCESSSVQHQSSLQQQQQQSNNQRQINCRTMMAQPILPPPPPPPTEESYYGALSIQNTGATDSGFSETVSHPQRYQQQHQFQPHQTSQQQYSSSNLNNQFNNNNIQQQQQQHPSAANTVICSINNQNSLQLSNNINQQQQLQQTRSTTTTYDQIYLPISAHPSKLSPSSQNSSKQSPTTIASSNNQRSSTSSLDSSSSVPLMPINVKGMLLHGLPNDEVLRNWLASIKCEEYLRNFSDHGYDMYLITRMTPQDLAAIGCKSPATRKKLLSEIRKLNLEDDIPDVKPPPSLDKWLELLKLGEYYSRLVAEGYDSVDKVCQLTWEDLEEIGITKLGHQKRILLGIEKVKKLAKKEDEIQNDCSIYDVHPNHRISLNAADNRLGTLGRVRSGFFQTRTGANLDHRGLPVAKVMPAFKHVNSALVLNNNSNNTNGNANATGLVDNSRNNSNSDHNNHNDDCERNSRLLPSDQKLQNIYDIYKTTTTTTNGKQESESLNMSDLNGTTLKRNPPPLPPIRTNSLKFPEDPSTILQHQQQRHSINGHHQQIYGNNNNIYGMTTTNSTSFLRTPKLGTLTATTNKMLTVGGQIQTVTGQQTTVMRYTREAPLPPVQEIQRPLGNSGMDGSIYAPMMQSVHHHQPTGAANSATFNHISTNLDEESSNTIGHQLASADEFPPPPPCQ